MKICLIDLASRTEDLPISIERHEKSDSGSIVRSRVKLSAISPFELWVDFDLGPGGVVVIREDKVVHEVHASIEVEVCVRVPDRGAGE